MNRLLLFVYLAFLLSISLYTFKKPGYNWDMIPYMAIALQHDHQEPTVIHDTVYAIAQAQLPADTYGQLTYGGLPYRKTMAENAVAFNQQMPFYLIKPLYNGMVYLAYKSGMSLMGATVFPSTLCYCLIGILLVFWIKKYAPFRLALLISALMMASSPMWAVAGCSSPDALSTLLLLLALYAILETRSVVLVSVCFLTAIFARIDNVIPDAFLATLLVCSGKLSRKQYAWLLLGILLSYGCVSLAARPFGWSILFYPTFIQSMNLNYAFNVGFNLRDYIDLAKSHLMTGLFSSSLLLFLALGVFTLIGPRLSLRNSGFDQRLFATIVLVIAVRFVLQPVMADRLYIAYYLCILLLLLRRFRTI